MFSNADAKLYVGRWYQTDSWFYHGKPGAMTHDTSVDSRKTSCLDAYQSSNITIQVKYCQELPVNTRGFRFSEKENFLIENDHIENVITYRLPDKKEIHEYAYGKFQDDGSILWEISDMNAIFGVTWRRSNSGELSF